MQKETIFPREDPHLWDLNGATVYVIFIIVGCSSLLPWNAVITATSFFKSKYCGTGLEHLFETYYTVEFTLAQLLGLLSQLYLEVRCGYLHTVTKPLFFSSLLFSLLFLSTFLGDWLQGEAYFYVTSPVIFLLGYATIFLTSGVFARSAHFDSTRMSQGAMFGQAFAGVFVSLMSLTLASNSDLSSDDVIDGDDTLQNCIADSQEIESSAQIYFGVCSFTMWISLAAFAMNKLNGTVVYKSIDTVPSFEDIGEIQMSSNKVLNDTGTGRDSPAVCVDRESESRVIFEPNSKIISYDSADSLAVPIESLENFDSPVDMRECDGDMERMLEVLYTLKFFIITIILTFSGTLCIFPALVNEVWECHNHNNAAFTAILFLAFNVFGTSYLQLTCSLKIISLQLTPLYLISYCPLLFTSP